MTAPERIWLDWPAANRGDPVYDDPPERETQPGQTGYTRNDVVQALIDAAVKAERERAAAMMKNGEIDATVRLDPARHSSLAAWFNEQRAAAIRKGTP